MRRGQRTCPFEDGHTRWTYKKNSKHVIRSLTAYRQIDTETKNLW